MQVRKMSELSDGQKSRVVLAKLGRDVPHILLLDEPTNHLGKFINWHSICFYRTFSYTQKVSDVFLITFLDMESIDALAIAVNNFSGGLVLVSHDMRLISQVAKEIWICDNKTIEKYKGDIMNFKMDLRKAQGLGEDDGKLKGDASVKAGAKQEKPKVKKVSKLSVVKPKVSEPTISEEPVKEEKADAFDVDDVKESLPSSTEPAAATEAAPPKKAAYVPPHLRNK